MCEAGGGGDDGEGGVGEGGMAARVMAAGVVTWCRVSSRNSDIAVNRADGTTDQTGLTGRAWREWTV